MAEGELFGTSLKKELRALKEYFKGTGFLITILPINSQKLQCQTCKANIARGSAAIESHNGYDIKYHLECFIKHLEKLNLDNFHKIKKRKRWIVHCQKEFPKLYKMNVMAQI